MNFVKLIVENSSYYLRVVDEEPPPDETEEPEEPEEPDDPEDPE